MSSVTGSVSPAVAEEDEPVLVLEQRALHWMSPPLSPTASSSSSASTAASTSAVTSTSTFSFRCPSRPPLPLSSSSTPASALSLSPPVGPLSLPSPSSPPSSLSPSSPPPSRPSKGRSFLPLLSVGRSAAAESPHRQSVSASSSAASTSSSTPSVYSSYPQSSSSNGSRSPRTSPHSPTPTSPPPVTTPLSSSSSSSSSSQIPLSSAAAGTRSLPLSPSSVAELLELNARLAQENAAMKEVLSRATSRRPSVEGRPAQEAEAREAEDERQRRLFPLIGSALPPPSNGLSSSAPSASTKGGEEGRAAEEQEEEEERKERERERRQRVRSKQSRYQTLGGGGLTRRINELRGEVMQSLPSALLAPPLPSPLPPPSLPPSSSPLHLEDGPAVDRVRSLPLRAVRAQRKTAPADLSDMMEQWRKLHLMGKDPTLQLDKATAAPAQGGSGGGGGSVEGQAKGRRSSGRRQSSSSSGSSEEDEEEDEGPTGERRQKRKEEKEQGRRQSWARGAATMNHAEVRMMMDMMRAAKQSKATAPEPPLLSHTTPQPPEP